MKRVPDEHRPSFVEGTPGGGVVELLKDSADVHVKDGYGWTALTKLCHNFSVTPDMLKLLLEAGADVSAADDLGYTPLHYLCNLKEASKQLLIIFHNCAFKIELCFNT